jgi:hypothetical protein
MWDSRGRAGRCALFSSCALLVAAATAGAPRIVAIPGPVRSVPAPDASGGRIFYRPHIGSDGAQASPVFYDDGQGRVRQVATLTRDMGIGWSPDGARVLLQDNWGSNIADCYVLTRVRGGITGLSLLKLAQRTPGHPTGIEAPFEAHYYVHCDRWRSSGQISGAISGHTDTNPLHDFDYPFTYDAHTRRIMWRR